MSGAKRKLKRSIDTDPKPVRPIIFLKPDIGDGIIEESYTITLAARNPIFITDSEIYDRILEVVEQARQSGREGISE
jgi:hypothetical protein